MALTRDFKQTVSDRMQRHPALAQALFDEALKLMLAGDGATARLLLRDLINSTVGCEKLAGRIDKPAKSPHRMFMAQGDPSMDNLSSVVHPRTAHSYLNQRGRRQTRTDFCQEVRGLGATVLGVSVAESPRTSVAKPPRELPIVCLVAAIDQCVPS